MKFINATLWSKNRMKVAVKLGKLRGCKYNKCEDEEIYSPWKLGVSFTDDLDVSPLSEKKNLGISQPQCSYKNGFYKRVRLFELVCYDVGKMTRTLRYENFARMTMDDRSPLRPGSITHWHDKRSNISLWLGWACVHYLSCRDWASYAQYDDVMNWKCRRHCLPKSVSR